MLVSKRREAICPWHRVISQQKYAPSYSAAKPENWRLCDFFVSFNNVLLVVKITAMNDWAMNRERKDETSTILPFFSTYLWKGAEEYE